MAGFTFRNISIKDKLILIQFIVALLAILTCTTIFFFSALNTFKQTQRVNAESLANVIAENSQTPLIFNMPSGTQNMLGELRLEPNIMNAVITDKYGRSFSEYNKSGEKKYAFGIPEDLPAKGAMIADGVFTNFFYPITDRNEENVDKRLGYLCLRMDNVALDKIRKQYFNTALLSLAAALLTAIIISFFLQRSISQPLKKLLIFVKRVSNTKDYSLRVKDEGSDEIAVLSNQFDDMLHRINRRDSSLQEARDQLEDRVEERTQQLQEANEQLIERTKALERSNKELEQFAYVASHDLQEPLRSIGGFTQLLGKKYKGQIDDEADEYISFVTDGVNRMQSLIKDLLLFSRLGRLGGKLVKTDLSEVLTNTQLNLRYSIDEAGATIHAEELPTLVADKLQIGHLFQNLISNAIKFRAERPPHINITVENLKDAYQFGISDNGIGIEKEYQERIFLIFQRLHTKEEYQGSGIGLAICKKIVELHDGKIWLESQPKQGSTFFFTISKKLKEGDYLINSPQNAT